MIKFNISFQFNLTNIINKNVRFLSKQAHSYFGDQKKNINDFISDSQEWLNNLAIELPYIPNFNKISKQAHTYLDYSINYISERFENSNLKSFQKQAYLYWNEHKKTIDLVISEKQNWITKKTNELSGLIKKKKFTNKKIVFLNDRRAGFILEKLDNFHFINHSNFPLLFLIKFIRRLLELAQLSKLMFLSKKNFYSLELSEIRIVRAPPFNLVTY